MTVGFFNVWRGDTTHIVCADMMIRSVRRTMPGVEIVQLTDLDSPQLHGVDRCERLPAAASALLHCRHFAALPGDWLLLDTDVLVERDVRDVFRWPFDIAVADRIGTMVNGEVGSKFMQDCPYNCGVVFSRSPEFWRECCTLVEAMSPDKQRFMGIQYAACEVIAANRYYVKVLPGLEYNYPPRSREDDTAAAILHFKGRRKAMMLARMAQA